MSRAQPGLRWAAALKLLLALALVALPLSAVAAGLPIWPKPSGAVSWQPAGSAVSLEGATPQFVVQVIDQDTRQAAEAYLAAAFQLAYADWGCGAANGSSSSGGGGGGVQVQIVVTPEDPALCLDPNCYTTDTNEWYNLQASSSGIILTAYTVVGVQWGLSTLASLSGTACKLEGLPMQIDDQPRFPHRGLMLDTARNWFSVEALKKKVLDPMHASKLNVLHWHVYDSQSQPLEVRFNPSLHQPFSPDQSYSQDDAREIVAYAWQRGIRVIPEFDMPGHTASMQPADPALFSCYNHLPWDGEGFPNVVCNQPPCGQLTPGEATNALVTDFLTEMAELFPGTFLSTGADEVNFNCWNNGTVVPQDSPDYPQFRAGMLARLAGFQTHVADTLQAVGKRMMVWGDSFLEYELGGTPALPPDAALIFWQDADMAPAATDAGYEVVYSPYRTWYLDCGLGTKPSAKEQWCQPLNTWDAMYASDPLEHFNATSGGNPEKVLGGQTALWTEHVVESILDYVVWPRPAAVAERLWSNREDTQDLQDADSRLQRFSDQLRARGLNPAPLSWQGNDFAFDLQTAWCNNVTEPVVDHLGDDYCAAAETYRDVELTFENLIAADETK